MLISDEGKQWRVNLLTLEWTIKETLTKERSGVSCFGHSGVRGGRKTVP